MFLETFATTALRVVWLAVLVAAAPLSAVLFTAVLPVVLIRNLETKP